MAKTTKITFITPAYNREKYLPATLDSLLAQSFKDWECILVDDGSTDGTLDIMQRAAEKDKRFRVIRTEHNCGVSAARNRALEAAAGTYIINLDSDDLIGPEFASAAYTYMSKHRDCPAVFGRMARFDDSGQRTEEKLREYAGLLSLMWRNCHNVTACYRRSDALALGGYREGLPALEDWDFWIRLYDRAGQGPVGIDVLAFEYRSHPGSLTEWATQHRKEVIERMKGIERELYERNRPEATTKDTVWVVIPYISSEAQGREIVYAVAGWNRHFREPHRICIVGDRPPQEVLDMPGVEWLEKPRQNREDYPGQYLPHIDHAHKFSAFLEAHPEVDGFIRVADDCYAVNDFDLPFVRQLRLNRESMSGSGERGGWYADEEKTMKLLKRLRFPTRGWTTHLPLYYERRKLMHIIDTYDLLHNSYVIEALYFNMWYPHRVAQLLNIDFDCVRCGVWRSNPRLNYIDNAFRTKVWITNSIAGWIPALEERLKNYFGI